MAKKKSEATFVCRECGAVSNKWTGKCLACGAWSSLDEKAPAAAPARGLGGQHPGPVRLKDIAAESMGRMGTGNSEFDRVLGGGLAQGALVLVGGDPGVGKSTLLLQTAGNVAAAGFRVLYVTGEESAAQVKLRSHRLGLSGSDLMLLPETDLSSILATARETRPDLLVVDSIQTVYRSELPGTPGSIHQLRECTLELMVFSKSSGCPVFLVGHVTKDGQIAGPRLLEHMVDTVAYFEGDRGNAYRLLRTVKNRFGATDEVGVFEMTAGGLTAVENPSRLFLAQGGEPRPGSAVGCAMEGSRALLFEVQALVGHSNYAVAQRVAAGIEAKRLTILLALLDRFGGIQVGNNDVFVSVAGGLRVDDPAADLALAAAIASNHLGFSPPPRLLLLGELGLGGEIRAVSQVESRLKEAQRQGFQLALVPQGSTCPSLPGLEVHPMGTLESAIRFLREFQG